MRIAVAADSRDVVSRSMSALLESLGHEVVARHGAIADGAEDTDPAAVWSVCARAAALDVVEGRADQAVVACWTGTGVSIAANKVPGIRAALCTDSVTAAGARRWNDANVLALSLRLTSMHVLREIFEGWFETDPSPEPDDVAAIARVEPRP
ncbi:MAG TPA: RpiB/LacA/LacB family sugar-phosphate isomerase [Actinospica sp.]|jgi:ribose 5-phosphate isomerase B|nr:RpiB/LacA/LacB family sugar-phosphate isomerase [Actinospica sp.]